MKLLLGEVLQITSSNEQVVYPSAIVHRADDDENIHFGLNDGPGTLVNTVILPDEVLLSTQKSTARLVPLVHPADTDNKKVFLQSSDKNIVNVSDNGLITAILEGQATITATSESSGIQESCLVKVINEHTFTSLCLADTYVYDGKSDNARDTNYGSEDKIVVKKDGERYNRESFLKFYIADLDKLDPDVHAIKVVASVGLSSTGTTVTDANWQLSPVNDTDWNENE